jgi:rRNA maturation endonuclease Nob1
MASFRCRACSQDGDFIYQASRHVCPRCGSTDVQFAVRIEELPDDDPLIQAMELLAEQDGEKNHD